MAETGEVINGVHIAVKAPWDPPLTCRDTLKDRTNACILQVEENGQIKPGEAEDLLCCDAVRVVGSFFDRDPTIFRWYYSILARADGQGKENEIATALVGKGKEPVHGPVVIVKDAPWKHWKELDKEIDPSKVVQTIWYYLKSGVPAEEEFGTRTLIRVLGEQA